MMRSVKSLPTQFGDDTLRFRCRALVPGKSESAWPSLPMPTKHKIEPRKLAVVELEMLLDHLFVFTGGFRRVGIFAFHAMNLLRL